MSNVALTDVTPYKCLVLYISRPHDRVHGVDDIDHDEPQNNGCDGNVARPDIVRGWYEQEKDADERHDGH